MSLLNNITIISKRKKRKTFPVINLTYEKLNEVINIGGTNHN